MKIQTLSLVVGSEACNAGCPFCVSKMTPPQGIELKPPDVRWDRLEKTIQFAKAMNVTTVILTGKGEPTLFPQQVLDYLARVGQQFPFVELQTNGLTIAEGNFEYLNACRVRGLTTVAISVVHHLPEVNQRIYFAHRPKMEYPALEPLIKKIHDHGLSVRLAVVMISGAIDNPAEVSEMIEFARANDVEQLSFRPVTQSSVSRNDMVSNWIDQGMLTDHQVATVAEYLSTEGQHLLTLQHGAVVYDVRGQNVCLTDCLTLPKGEEIRQAIFFPDGHLRYDWQYPGAILM